MRIALAFLAALAGAGPGLSSDDPTASGLAARLASWGPRPAGSAAEERAQRLVARTFRDAGLSVRTQELRLPAGQSSRNVIGVYDTPARCLRIVMAHADTTPGSPGANDNASGVAVVAELAARLERIGPRCDVWLVATGAEERVYTGSPDHLGALALARRAARRSARLDWALSLDEVGGDRPFWLRSPAAAARGGVEGALLRAARSVGLALSWVRDEGSGNSDHREFELLGLPAAKLGVGAGGEPCRHLPCDRAGRLDPRSLRQARRIVAQALR